MNSAAITAETIRLIASATRWAVAAAHECFDLLDADEPAEPCMGLWQSFCDEFDCAADVRNVLWTAASATYTETIEQLRAA